MAVHKIEFIYEAYIKFRAAVQNILPGQQIWLLELGPHSLEVATSSMQPDNFIQLITITDCTEKFLEKNKP